MNDKHIDHRSKLKCIMIMITQNFGAGGDVGVTSTLHWKESLQVLAHSSSTYGATRSTPTLPYLRDHHSSLLPASWLSFCKQLPSMAGTSPEPSMAVLVDAGLAAEGGRRPIFGSGKLCPRSTVFVHPPSLLLDKLLAKLDDLLASCLIRGVPGWV